MKIKTADQVLLVKDEHVLEWPDKLFCDQPIDNGLPFEESWRKLVHGNLELEIALPSEAPVQQLGFFH